ncbi:MAG TPA: glucose-6-phosphate dehydrogenase [Dehalococcoidia bacterium]|nr:glucose-6-phosphate dehydrogenase [Dehalococcoidia bacterium]
MALRAPQPQDIVIMGASGDLSRRKLIPAVYNLSAASLLPAKGDIVGFARTDLGEQGFRDFARRAVQEYSYTGFDETVWSELVPRLRYLRSEGDGYSALNQFLHEKERLVYLAMPPSALPKAISGLREADLAQGTRVVVEKPFGHDLASACELNRIIHEVFHESEVFRIDHYLGKETVQNILVFRFGNSAFERIWNRDAVDHIQVTVAESIGIEGRGAYFEEVGIVRDIVQNHVLQVLSLLTMEPPSNMAPESIRDEKIKVLRAMQPLNPARTVRGQYAAGTIDGAAVPGYCQEKGVSPDSMTATFFAAQLGIDSWRWAGVPFHVRTGKRLPCRATEIVVQFRDPPLCFFEGTEVKDIPSDHLVMRIQPDEGIRFAFLAKRPGPEINVQSVGMDFNYRSSFMTTPPEAYERLLHDAMLGDHTLFMREDAAERAWAIVEPVLDNPTPTCTYPAGTWGPREAEQLIAPCAWHLR